MSTPFSTLTAFINKLKGLGFWRRVFSWSEVKADLIDAAVNLSLAEKALASAEKNLSEARLEYSVLQEAKRHAELLLQNMHTELGVFKERVQTCERVLQQVTEENIRLKKEDEFRSKKYAEEIASLQEIKTGLQQQRAAEQEERHQQELSRLAALKETWMLHQTDVQGKIKSICQKHTLPYIDKPPFRGEPDNTLLICDEYVVFDAKSPAGDDLKNFPLYLKAQAEAAKKYAKIEGIKKEMFLVVPSNTLHCLKDYVFNMADYDVFVISADALEPVILALFKIENYEFAEQLSPDDRENICRIIGKFAHLSKRRIQVDAFFARQFIELAYKCENNLPAEIHNKVLEFEKSEKLNPPQEKRAKAINVKDLETDHVKIELELGRKGIIIPAENIAGALNQVGLQAP